LEKLEIISYSSYNVLEKLGWRHAAGNGGSFIMLPRLLIQMTKVGASP